MRFTTTPVDPSLLTLPWSTPLEDWPADELVTLPRGLSRHVVRFVARSGSVYAVKELPERAAFHEHAMLRGLAQAREPAVRPVGVVSQRRSPAGATLDAALVTAHLDFSLPFRLLFSSPMAPSTLDRLLDALVILLVRLHVEGLWWGDCSLSNVLFRRDAGAFMAYLVDAETAELHPQGLTDGQRTHDLEIASTNIAGELLDLAAGGQLPDHVDAVASGLSITDRYQGVWEVLYGTARVAAADLDGIGARLQRLRRLGFDAEQLDLATDDSGAWLDVRPQIVEPDYHHRKLVQVTGLAVQENQARSLLADIGAFRVAHGIDEVDEERAARRWLAEAFAPTIEAIPPALADKLEPAELYHEVLQHRWQVSPEGTEIPLVEAVARYVDEVLVHRPDERRMLAGPSRPGSEKPTSP